MALKAHSQGLRHSSSNRTSQQGRTRGVLRTDAWCRQHHRAPVTAAVFVQASHPMCSDAWRRQRHRASVTAAAIMAPDTAATTNGAGGGSGGYETSWYAWPEGYLGQSFNLAGKLEPRAAALRDDIDVLSQACQLRREESQFSEHTVTSAEDAAAMVGAVVGADVDMGLLKAGGSASFELYQSYKTNTISHNLVASFQQNQLLEKNQLKLSWEARNVLKRMGPEEFRARYGTHFVCGVGYRGAFIGALNIRMQERNQSIAAGAAFKASYGKFSGSMDVKAAMKNAGIDCEVTVEWSKWGADDDASLDELEENCASDNPSITGIRQLAMQTADRAQGYPKLVKLRPYSTLPDYVEACAQSGNPLPALYDQEPAMAYLTDRYRRAAYIMSALERERRTGCSSNVSRIELTTRLLVAELEEAFKNKQVLKDLGTFFKYNYPAPGWPAYDSSGASESSAQAGKALVDSFDTRVFQLDFDLFKYVHKPLCLQKSIVGRLWDSALTEGGTAIPDPPNSVHVAAVSSGSSTSPLGGWFLDYQEQETFTQPGLYIVTLGLYDGIFQQVGATQCFRNTEEEGKAANKFVAGAMTYGTENNTTFVVFKVGDCCSKWSKADADTLHLGAQLRLQCQANQDLDAHRSWASVSYPSPKSATWGLTRRQAVLRSYNGTGDIARKEPDNTVLIETILKY